jgi:Sec-independent protein translocase protein TatA
MVSGIKTKLNRGEDLETILSGYKKLTDEEKDQLREEFKVEEVVEEEEPVKAKKKKKE